MWWLGGWIYLLSMARLSVVDMLIIDRSILQRLNYFKVENFNWYSDHALTSFSLKVKMMKPYAMPRSWNKMVKSFQVWNDETKQNFMRALQAPDIQSLLDDITNCNHADANIATLKFTDILQLTIHKVFLKQVRSAYKTSVKRKTRYSQECQLGKRAFKKAQRQLKVDKGNLNRRKKICKREKDI